MTLARLSAAVLVALMLLGCGQKGALVAPEPPPPVEADDDDEKDDDG